MISADMQLTFVFFWFYIDLAMLKLWWFPCLPIKAVLIKSVLQVGPNYFHLLCDSHLRSIFSTSGCVCKVGKQMRSSSHELKALGFKFLQGERFIHVTSMHCDLHHLIHQARSNRDMWDRHLSHHLFTIDSLIIVVYAYKLWKTM